MFELSTSDFIKIRDLIHDKYGLYFEEKKLYFVEKRLKKRIVIVGVDNARDYYRFIKYGNNPEELQLLVESLTTNETYFYRHQGHLKSFILECIPLILKDKKEKGNKKLKIWSAATSSGEEIYTLAILLKEHISDLSNYSLTLTATDIDRKILKKAALGLYDERSIKDVPANLLNKYFTLTEDGLYQLGDEIKSMVEFKSLNLMNEPKMKTFSDYDVIFCRNVLIYFNDDSRKVVLHHFYSALNKGGFIFLGPSESVGKISAAFKLVKFKYSLNYQK